MYAGTDAAGRKQGGRKWVRRNVGVMGTDERVCRDGMLRAPAVMKAMMSGLAGVGQSS